MRIKTFLAATLTAVAVLGATAAPALAGGPRPLFQMPFPCGEQWRMATYNGHDDYEIDMTKTGGGSLGRPIVASFAGSVIASGYSGGAGNRVRLYHGGGWQTEYYHMVSAPVVSVGQTVQQGQVLGYVGSTGDSSGPHLHYAQRADGTTSALGTVVQSYFNGHPVDITDDARANSFPLTSNNCGAAAQPPLALDAGDVDVNGDGRSDLVAQNADSVWVKLSNGSSFGAAVQWASGAFYGATVNLAGDVNGDGRADLVAQNGTDVWAILSTGSSFSAPVQWASGTAFYGSVADHIGDVNGDGRADLIAQNEQNVWVRISTGSSFNAPVQWATGTFYGDTANLFGDVNGDGRADLIAQNGSDAWVKLSNGSSFGAPVQWTTGSFPGTKKNHADDVNGDGRVDLIAQNDANVWVKLSNGSSFGAPVQWTTGSFYGGIANLAGDVTGDGRADLIAQNSTDVWVKSSSGSSFGAPVRWSTGTFYGNVANLG